jgi:NAD(P)-dependent dehydrogenase (short-subunit alcohol dehydrogenase family)
MPGRFEGKVAVLTGAASGIGLGTATRLAAEGARVVLGDVAEEQLAAAVTTIEGVVAASRLRDVAEEQLAAAVDVIGGEAVAAGVRCDVTVEADVEALVAAAVERFGGVDLAVNCAGVGTFSPIADHPVDEWRRIVDICLTGVFLAVKHEARAMRAAGRDGAIVNIASLNARQPGEGMAAYCSAKAGVEMLTRCAAMELGPHGIRVTGVGPGLVDTPLTGFTRDFPMLAERYRANTPLGRTGTVDDVAATVCWLLSDEASWISGDTLYADGAAHTREYPRFFDLLG